MTHINFSHPQHTIQSLDKSLRCEKRSQKKKSVLGLEPRISCSVGRRLIHWAIRTCTWETTTKKVFEPRIELGTFSVLD